MNGTPICCHHCGEPLPLVTGLLEMAKRRAQVVDMALACLAERFAALAPCHACPLWDTDKDECTSTLDEGRGCECRVAAWAIDKANEGAWHG